jgi:hypothetical protein
MSLAVGRYKNNYKKIEKIEKITKEMKGKKTSPIIVGDTREA